MNKLKFKISQAPSIGSSLSVNIRPRKWYISWLWVKVFLKWLHLVVLYIVIVALCSCSDKDKVDPKYGVQCNKIEFVDIHGDTVTILTDTIYRITTGGHSVSDERVIIQKR